MVARLSDPIIPYPYGTVPVFAPIPGNKLPGYFHNVPTGQRHLTPVHEFDSASPLEDEETTPTRCPSPSITPHTFLRSIASVVAEKTPLPSVVHRRPTSPQFDLANSTEHGLLPPTGLHPLPALTARLRY